MNELPKDIKAVFIITPCDNRGYDSMAYASLEEAMEDAERQFDEHDNLKVTIERKAMTEEQFKEFWEGLYHD